MTKILSTSKISKKDIICQKAASAIRTRGYKASTMRDLAMAIGVEAPSLYNHIGSKSEILQHICFYVASLYTEEIERIEEMNLPEIKKIEMLIRHQVRIQLTHFDEVYIANSEIKHLPEPYLNQFLQKRKAYENILVNWLKAGMHSKNLKKAHPQMTALTMLSAVRGLEHWYKYKDQVSLKVIENNIVNQLISGITI